MDSDIEEGATGKNEGKDEDEHPDETIVDEEVKMEKENDEMEEYLNLT